MTSTAESYVLGIDLGTTNSTVCVSRDGGRTVETVKPDFQHDCFMNLLLPSIYCDARPANGILIGRAAQAMLKDDRYSNRVVTNVKRRMRKPGMLLPEKGVTLRNVPTNTPIDISAAILAYLRSEIALQLKIPERSLHRAVIGVPAVFGMIARNATIQAGQRAGFNEVDVIPEPIAAAFGLRLHESKREQVVLILDLGGGTFDATLLHVGPGVGRAGFEVLGVDGHPQLGGLEWDKCVSELAIDELSQNRNFDTAQLNFESNVLFSEKCEAAKIDLFNAYKQGNLNYQAMVEVEVPIRGTQSDTRIQRPAVKLKQFLQETDRLFTQITNICQSLLKNSGSDPATQEMLTRRRGWGGYFKGRSKAPLSWDDIDQIVLVGGGAYMKPLRERVFEMSGRHPIIPREPQMNAAEGAAICGALRGTDSDLFNSLELRSPYTLAFRYIDDAGQHQYQTLIECNERIPQIGLDRPFTRRAMGKGKVFLTRLYERDLHSDTSEIRWQAADELRIHPLPPPIPGGDENVQINLHCDAQLRFTATAKYRGQSVSMELKAPQEEQFEGGESASAASETLPFPNVGRADDLNRRVGR